MFQRKVVGWAHISGALKHCAGDAQPSGGDARNLDWCRLIKSSDDAVSKVSEQYVGAPQYLVDIVRHRLIFDSVDTQYRCLLSICQDPSVVVVRIDNKQHSDKRSAPSHVIDTFQKPAITVHVVLVTPEALDMGVSGHVLELELILHKIWMLFQLDHAHHSYLSYRRALLSEQSIPTRWIRRLVVNAVRCRRARARVVALQNDCPPDQTKQSGPGRPGGQAHPALDVVGGCALTASYALSCQQTGGEAIGDVQEKLGGDKMTGILTHCDIKSYFQVNSDSVKDCFQIGTCEDKQGIPPVLRARLGYDGLWNFNICSISGSANDNWHLKEIFDTLCDLPESVIDQTLMVGAEYQTPSNPFDDSRQEEVGGGEPEMCSMSPDMRDLLRKKCVERGDAKAHSVFEVCVCVCVSLSLSLSLSLSVRVFCSVRNSVDVYSSCCNGVAAYACVAM